MFNKHPLATAIGSVALASAFAGAGALPQIALAEDAIVEEVVVTGSRIPRAGFDTLQPAVVVDAEFIQQRGFTNIADALNQVPSFGSPGSSTEGNQDSYGVGNSYVNFFGLGSQRTLTLVNGRRFVSSNAPSVFSNGAAGLQVDLNTIPTAMVERVETIAVGGAPIYGADAIAGTVNIILKDDFEGFEVNANYGESEGQGDLEEKTFSMVFGNNFADDRGNIVMSFEYNDREGLIESQRDHLRAGWQFREPAGDSDFRRVLVRDAHANIVGPGGAITPGGGLLPNFGVGSIDTDGDGTGDSYFQFGPDGSLIPYNVGSPTGNAVWSVGGDGIFLPDVTSLYTPLERSIVSSFVTYDISDRVEAYGEFLFSNSNSTELVNQPAYQSNFFGDESFGLTFSADHPLLTPTARQQLADFGLDTFGMQRASVDLGDRRISQEGTVFRFVGGLRGDIELADRTLSWDAAYVRGRSDARTRQDEIVTSRFFYALDAITADDGSVACRVAADPDSRPDNPGDPLGATENFRDTFDGCVPLDLFGQGRPSQAAIDYITAAATSNTEINQEIFSINASVETIELPAGYLSIAAGYEGREERASFDVGGLAALGLGRGEPVRPTAGVYETDEFYAEAFAPVISPEMEVPFVYSASIEGAFRSVDNSLAGTDDIYTYGAKISPIPDVEFRANKTRSVRAPAITELFLPLSGIGSFASDPCDARFIDGGLSPEVRRANCVADGIADPDNFVSNVANASVQGQTGGNQNLLNEVADAWTAGVILRPRWFDSLTVAVDYVDFDIQDGIESFTLTQIMESCYDSTSFPNAFCGQFTRLPSGQLPATNAFTSGFVNAGERTLRAWTLDADWMTELSGWPVLSAMNVPGTLRVSANGFFPQEAKTVIQGAIDDSLGEPDTAETQVQLNVNWMWNKLSVLVQARYIGEADISNDDAPDARDVMDLKAVTLYNAAVQYELNENARIQLNIDNLFDKTPEVAAIAGGWDGIYDNRGRYIRAGIKVNL